MQRLENLKMRIVYCGAPLYYLCNPIPLDNPKNNTALPYITWGLIQDSKIKSKESLKLKSFSPDKKEVSLEIKDLRNINLTNFTRLLSRITKVKESNFMQTSCEMKEENPSCQTHCF